MNYGWECPRCQKIHSPFVNSCDCEPPVTVVTSWPVMPYTTYERCLRCGQMHPQGMPCPQSEPYCRDSGSPPPEPMFNTSGGSADGKLDSVSNLPQKIKAGKVYKVGDYFLHNNAIWRFNKMEKGELYANPILDLDHKYEQSLSQLRAFYIYTPPKED